jgi:hypothetical protein
MRVPRVHNRLNPRITWGGESGTTGSPPEGGPRVMPPNPGVNTVKAQDGNPVREETARQQPDRITVALIPQSSVDLQHLQDRTSLSKTDLVNRAIALYEFIDSQLRADQALIIRNQKTGEAQLVRLL